MVKEDFVCRKSSRLFPHSVILAKAGIQSLLHDLCAITPAWMPAYAGMTDFHVV
jgi:hypothetical protein